MQEDCIWKMMQASGVSGKLSTNNEVTYRDKCQE
jgi:hypothetical protein